MTLPPFFKGGDGCNLTTLFRADSLDSYRSHALRHCPQLRNLHTWSKTALAVLKHNS